MPVGNPREKNTQAYSFLQGSFHCGDSMRTFKRKMESLGAIVVGGLSLGKTKHERPVVVTETPRIFSHPPFPPQPTYDNSDDLPF